MKTKTINAIHSEYIYIVFIFLGMSGVYYISSNYLRTITVVPDEVLYYSLAKNIANGNGILLFNSQSDFVKILYSLFIAPAFLVQDQELSIRLVALINSLLVCSGIFPVYLLARKYLKNNLHIVYACVIYCTFSDLTYAMTFMSENLYLPMGLWGMLFTSKLIDLTLQLLENKSTSTKKYYVKSVFLGIYFYLLYFCKEVGLVFPVTYILFVLGVLLNNKMEHIQNYNYKKIICSLIIIVVVFCGMFLVVKSGLTVSDGTGIYSVTSDIFNNSYNFIYVCYGTVYFILMMTLAYGIFPIIIPIIHRQNMEKTDRYFSYFTYLMVVICAIVIAYEISAREDNGLTAPRIHLRYICYMFLPMVIMMLNAFEHTEAINKKIVVGVTSLICLSYIYVICFNKLLVSKQETIDQTMLKYLSEHTEAQWPIIIIVSIIFILISTVLSKKYKKGIILIEVLLLALNVVNTTQTVCMWRNTNNLSETDDRYCASLKVLDFISEHHDSNIVLLAKARLVNLISTNYTGANLYTLSYSDLQKYLYHNEDSMISWDTIKNNVHVQYFETFYKDLNSVDYIIIDDELISDFSVNKSEIVDSSIDGLKIYKVEDPHYLPDNFTSLLKENSYNVDDMIDDAMKKAIEINKSKASEGTSESSEQQN